MPEIAKYEEVTLDTVDRTRKIIDQHREYWGHDPVSLYLGRKEIYELRGYLPLVSVDGSIGRLCFEGTYVYIVDADTHLACR